MESFSSNRYVNLLKNSGFKAVFGDENNKDVIIGLLNILSFSISYTYNS